MHVPPECICVVLQRPLQTVPQHAQVYKDKLRRASGKWMHRVRLHVIRVTRTASGRYLLSLSPSVRHASGWPGLGRPNSINTDLDGIDNTSLLRLRHSPSTRRIFTSTPFQNQSQDHHKASMCAFLCRSNFSSRFRVKYIDTCCAAGVDVRTHAHTHAGTFPSHVPKPVVCFPSSRHRHALHRTGPSAQDHALFVPASATIN